MYCKNCGTQIENDSKFCFSCGTNVESISNGLNNQTNKEKEQTVFNQDSKNLILKVEKFDSSYKWNNEAPLVIGIIIFLSNLLLFPLISIKDNSFR